MHTNTILLFANVSRSQIEITDTHYKIKSIPVTVDDAVMNNIHYSAEENGKGLSSLIGKPVTLSHPRIDGVNVSGLSGDGLSDYFSGGTITNTYNVGGIWYADSSIKKSLLKAQEGGERYANALDNKDDIGVSTGLTFTQNEIKGVNGKGQKYDMSAVNQSYDHLAMLLDERPAGGEDTVMRFNSSDVEVFCVNDLIETLNESKEDSLINKIVNKLTAVFARDNETRYNSVGSTINTTLEDNVIMNRDEMLALLGLTANSAVTDDELKLLAANAIKTNAQEPVKADNTDIAETITNAVNAAVKPLQDELTSVKSQLAANADAEKAELVGQVVALNAGLSESTAKKMEVSELKEFLTANSKTFVNGAFAANGYQANTAKPSDHDFDLNAALEG